MTIKDEISHLQKCAEIGKRFKNADLEHLDSATSAYNYIRIADTIADHAQRENIKPANVLDWGSGYGQLAWLLKNRGVNVTGYNVEKREHVEEIPLLSEINTVYNLDLIKLPFKNESFDSIISCGVLEHVSDPAASLREIYRVLKRGGYFYIFMLPQKTSWVEILSHMRGISVHPVRYTIKSISGLLEQHDFCVENLWKFNLLPKNLTGLPSGIKRFYGRFYKTVYLLDSIFSRIPGLNLLSGVIEGVARKE